MPRAARNELELIEKVCSDIRGSGEITGKHRAKLLTCFADRFENALNLVREGKVRRYFFKPSRRVVWSVQGRKGEYQVIPEVNFCNCDDYYFRVLDRKRQACYHYLAQRLAEALKEYKSLELPDSEYHTITRQWSRVIEEAAREEA